jgi:hypothetical protein
MGYFFELAAELGDNPDRVAGLITCFDGVNWTLSDGTVIECQFRPNANDVWRGPDGNFWCRVTPNGVSVTGGPRSVTSDTMLSELIHQMYETLKKCSGFRFALVGWEVAESVEIKDLLNFKSAGDGLPAGLVVSRFTWQQMGSPETFLPFGVESFWKPLDNDDYSALVKLFND